MHQPIREKVTRIIGGGQKVGWATSQAETTNPIKRTKIMIGTTTHGRTATFTLTDAQLGNIRTLFEPIIDDFLERLSQRVRELQDAARPRFYSRREAADLLHVSLPTIHAMVKAGALVPKKIGARVLFDAALIDAGIADGSLQKAVWTKKRRA